MGKPRLTIEKVSDVCLEFGWVLISNIYINSSSPLEIMCEFGHVSKKNIRHIKEGRGCKACRGVSDRQDFEYIKNKAEELGLTILSTEYIDAHTKMNMVCNKGHQIEKTWHSIRHGQKCRECSYTDMSGEGNPNYNQDISEELRVKMRTIPEYSAWRRAVLKRDNYTCICCGKYNKKSVTHHVFNYRDNPDLRTDISNGVTMCEKDHLEFHKIYGRKNNTQEQLDEFISMKKSNNK